MKKQASTEQAQCENITNKVASITSRLNEKNKEDDNYLDVYVTPSNNLKKLVPDNYDMPVQLNKQLNEMKHLLVNAKQNGKYSVGGEAHELPANPQIDIHNHGLLQLPLDKTSGEELVNLCSQAPYGLNLETLVDTKVRNTLQLNPNQFEIKNEDWSICLDNLVDRVSDELGCNCKIEAKLYKLLLYKRGCHFLKHMDTEKEKRMFGTMVVQLPSIYKGGQLILYDGESKTEYNFGNNNGRAKLACQYAAHYADIEHEVLKVTTGYRLVLIYSLCWKSTNIPRHISNLNTNSVTKLSALIKKLMTNNFKIMSFMLFHKYTPVSLEQNGINVLKSIDNDRYSLIKAVGDKLSLDFVFYIANAKLIRTTADFGKTSDDDFGCSEGMPCANIIDKWFDLNGTPNESFNEEYTPEDFLDLCINPFGKEAQADLAEKYDYGPSIHKKKEPYLGNEGGTLISTYSKYLLIFWPKSYDIHARFRMSYKCGLDYLNCLINDEYLTRNDEPIKSFFKNWKTIRSNLNDLILPASTHNLVNNCELVQVMLKLNMEKEAKECFKETILPNLFNSMRKDNFCNLAYVYNRKFGLNHDGMYMFKEKNDYSGKYDLDTGSYEEREQKFENFYKLARMIMLVDEIYIKDYVIMVKKAKNIGCQVFNSLINAMTKNFHLFSGSNSIKELFEHRLRFIENKIKELPIDYRPYFYSSDLSRSDYSNEIILIDKYLKFFMPLEDLNRIGEYLKINLEIAATRLEKFIENELIDRDKLCQQLVEGLEQLKKDSDKKYHYYYYDCFKAYMTLIKVYFKLNRSDLAENIFKEHFKSYLDKDGFKKLLPQYCSSRNEMDQSIEKIYNLAECLVFLKSESKMNQFKQMLIENLDHNKLNVIIRKIRHNFEKFANFKAIKELFEHRLEFLNERCANMPEFTWKMPNVSFSSHPEVEEFYKSEKTEMIYSGKFKNIEDARQKFLDLRRTKEYSSKIDYGGWGKHAYVSIVKTKEYFYEKYGNLTEMNKEIKHINSLLIKFNL